MCRESDRGGEAWAWTWCYSAQCMHTVDARQDGGAALSGVEARGAAIGWARVAGGPDWPGDPRPAPQRKGHQGRHLAQSSLISCLAPAAGPRPRTVVVRFAATAAGAVAAVLLYLQKYQATDLI